MYNLINDRMKYHNIRLGKRFNSFALQLLLLDVLIATRFLIADENNNNILSSCNL